MTRNEEVESWYKQYHEVILKTAPAKSPEDSEDILQNLTLTLLTDKNSWVKLSTKKVMKWTVWKYYNQGKHSKAFTVPLEDAEELASPEVLTDQLIAKRSLELVTELVNSLGGASKTIFQMRFFQDMGYEEIADELNMNHKSVKQLGSRANKIVVEKFKSIVK